MNARLLALALGALPLALPAQVSVGGIAAFARARSTTGGLERSVKGPAIGASAGLGLWVLRLEGGYIEGSLLPSDGGAKRDLVEGWGFFGLEPVNGLTLRGGPRIRTYLTGDNTERWISWEVHLRAERDIMPRRVRGYIEGWRSVAGKVNLNAPLQYVQGGEAGMIVRPFDAPVWARIGYRMDRARLRDVDLVETTELFMLRVGVGGS